MRIHPLSADRVVNVTGPKVAELLGDPTASAYFRNNDSYYASGRFECDCPACVEDVRLNRLMEYLDER